MIESETYDREVRIVITRMIYVQVPQDKVDAAHKVWKEHCAPLMIGMKGCLSEQMLTCVDNPGEMISMSTWESQADIEAYRKSKEHDEIQRHTRELLSGARATVKTYELAA
jgi:heme-degrading monooxygenase HmoA